MSKVMVGYDIKISSGILEVREADWWLESWILQTS